MSELVVYKANELAVSRYDLTEHETKLILFCVAKLNPTIETPTKEQRTVIFSCAEYARVMGISNRNAWGRLHAATRNLFKRSVELIYPTGAVSSRIFNWTEYAEFNRDNQTVKLVFSEYIIPLLFHLKKFIKYNLDYVKAFENKYSMRIYEWLLKELTQRKTYTANIEISIADFKFMLVLENKHSEFKELNRWVLKPVIKDLNTYSNMKLVIEKRGRPADTLIFQVALNQPLEPGNNDSQKTNNATRTPIPAINMTEDELLYREVANVWHRSLTGKIQLTEFDEKFLYDMQGKYYLNGSFSWLTDKQREKLEQILSKHRGF